MGTHGTDRLPLGYAGAATAFVIMLAVRGLTLVASSFALSLNPLLGAVVFAGALIAPYLAVAPLAKKVLSALEQSLHREFAWVAIAATSLELIAIVATAVASRSISLVAIVGMGAAGALLGASGMYLIARMRARALILPAAALGVAAWYGFGAGTPWLSIMTWLFGADLLIAAWMLGPLIARRAQLTPDSCGVSDEET